MSDKPHPSATQASPENIVDVEVGNGATRYDWSIALSRVCMRWPSKDRDVALAAVIRIAEYPKRGTGRCEAKRDTIADELGISERHLNRGIKVLKDHGWIKLQRGGPNDVVIITLTIPSDDADIHRFGSKKPDVIQDNKLSCMNGFHTGQKTGSYRTGLASLQDIQSVPCNEQVEQIEQSAASPRAPEYADREEDNIELMIERYGSTRARGALTDPYNDPGYIEFADTPQPRNPTSSLHASS